MRPALALIPSVFFLLAYVGTEGLRDIDLARRQSEANRLSAEMNRLSANMSRAIQAVSLGTASYEDVQTEINEGNGRLARMQRDLEAVWSEMDGLKVKAAHDEALGRALRLAGTALSILAFGIIGSREAKFAPHCLVAMAVILGLLAV